MQIYISYEMERFYWALMGTCWLRRTYTSRRRLPRTLSRTTTTTSRRSSSLKGGVLSWDYPLTPCTRLPVPTDPATKDQLRYCNIRNIRNIYDIRSQYPLAISAISETSAISAISEISATSALCTCWPSNKQTVYTPSCTFLPSFLTQRLDFITQFMYIA